MSKHSKLSEDSKKVTEFIEEFKKESEQLVRETFPKKVLEIDELYKQVKAEKSLACNQPVDIPYPVPVETSMEPSAKKRKTEMDVNNHSSEITGTRVLVFPGGPVPYNKFVRSYCEKAKPLMQGLMEHSNKVRMWINFLIPKIEDGNNFGVAIQEDVVSEARQVESEASAYLDQISRYYLQRARIITKIAKYPHIGTKFSVIYREIVENYGEHAMSMTKSISGVHGSKTAEQVYKMNQGLDARTKQTMTGTQLELMSSSKSTEE
ncbi:proteasome activator complex subunit 3 [Plakobranchus ocellatus]|uniref:Proteasome activator complex subunit 3 n=1 Tax=Plakobranchus ocellatus TaxID=259542 RepID=A0AAV4DCJ6_9GAST|nr:proteasome activator complex subunit 3 [Plakobranchus ocellatus]